VNFISNGSIITTVSLIIIVVALVTICLCLLKFSYKKIERQKINLNSISTADGEVVGFLIAYLLPILSVANPSIDYKVIGFIAGMFLIVIWTTNSYHINPLINLVGYHFYEVSADDNVTYLLLTKKELRKTSSVKTIIHLTEYMILDGEE
jgi:amino acid transporter